MSTKSPVNLTYAIESSPPLCQHRKIPHNIQNIYCHEKPIRLEEKTYLRKIGEISNSFEENLLKANIFYRNKKDLETSIFALERRKNVQTLIQQQNAAVKAFNVMHKFRQGYRKSKQFWLKTKTVEPQQSLMWIMKPWKEIKLSDMELAKKFKEKALKEEISKRIKAKGFRGYKVIKREQNKALCKEENKIDMILFNRQYPNASESSLVKKLKNESSLKWKFPNIQEQLKLETTYSKEKHEFNITNSYTNKSSLATTFCNPKQSSQASESSHCKMKIEDKNQRNANIEDRTKISLNTNKSFLNLEKLKSLQENKTLDLYKESNQDVKENSFSKIKNKRRHKRSIKRQKNTKSSLETNSLESCKCNQETNISIKHKEFKTHNKLHLEGHLINKSPFYQQKSFRPPKSSHYNKKNSYISTKILDKNKNSQSCENSQSSGAIESFKASKNFVGNKKTKAHQTILFSSDKKPKFFIDNCDTKENTKSFMLQNKTTQANKSLEVRKSSDEQKKFEEQMEYVEYVSKLNINEIQNKLQEKSSSQEASNKTKSHLDLKSFSEVKIHLKQHFNSLLQKKTKFKEAKSPKKLENLKEPPENKAQESFQTLIESKDKKYEKHFKDSSKFFMMKSILENYPHNMGPKEYPNEFYNKKQKSLKAPTKALTKGKKINVTNVGLPQDSKVLQESSKIVKFYATKDLSKKRNLNKINSSKPCTSSCYSKTLELLTNLGKAKTNPKIILNNFHLQFAKNPLKALENVGLQVMNTKSKRMRNTQENKNTI